MEITRQYYEREGYYNFNFKQGNKILEITFGGNLDLYWSLSIIKEHKLTTEETVSAMYDEVKETFIITKENYFIYSLFEELYSDIKESRIFIPIIKPVKDEADADLNEDEFDHQKYNERHKNMPTFKKLFNGETIEWRSDEEEFSVANRVTIEKIDDTFVLEFTRPYLSESKRFSGLLFSPNNIHIRFRNSGSTYDPYNVIFMRMFNKLQEYNPEYHQIHLEEINYHKKRSLKK